MSTDGGVVLKVEYYRRGGLPLTVGVKEVGAKLRLTFPYHVGMLAEVKDMAGARWDKGQKVWYVDRCDRNLLQLAVLAGNSPSWYQRQGDPVDTEAVLAEVNKLKPLTRALLDHQRPMLATSVRRRRHLLGADMGTGKTLVAIELLEYVNAVYPAGKLLYVGRKNPLAATQLEFKKWRSPLAYRPDLLTFVTFSSLHSLLEQWPQGEPAPRCVVFDESQNLKNPGTKQSEAATHLTAAMAKDHGDDRWVLTMTGTPQPQDYVDWWSQCEVTQAGWLREGSVHAFRRRLAVVEQVDGAYGSYPKFVRWRSEEVEKLGRRLEGLVTRVARRDVLTLPEPVYEEIYCRPSDDMVQAAELLVLRCNAGLDLLNKLSQLADGVSYDGEDDGARLVSTARCPKDEAVEMLLDRHCDAGRFGLFARYKASVDKLVDACRLAGWDVLRVDGRGMQLFGREGKDCRYQTADQALLALQTSGQPDDRLAFVGHPKAGGVGLNLQGISALCFYSNTYEGGDRAQAEARPQRLGNKGLTIYDLISLPTDRLVAERVKAKLDAQGIVLSDIKAAMARRIR